MQAADGLTLIIIGLMLLAGYLAYLISKKIPIPNVTILLLTGIIFGPSVLDLIPHQTKNWFPLVSHIALAMIGFLLGESFVIKEIREKGKTVLYIMLGETITTAVLVFIAVYLVSRSLELALVLAGIAPASAPAAIFETIRGIKAKGKLTDTVLNVVAIDDGVGVILFSVLFVAAQTVSGRQAGMQELLNGLWEVFGAILLGLAVSVPMAWATPRAREGEITLIEAAGFVILCSGIASLIHVSYLLACMVLGAVLANCSSEERRSFSAIEGVREPFLAIFFILSGLELQPDKLVTLGIIGLTYILARSAGLISGALLAGKAANAPREVTNRLGFCILPQAGVALGFALLAKEKIPQLGDTVLTLVIATTVIFEITGPLIARYNLQQAGELHKKNQTEQKEERT